MRKQTFKRGYRRLSEEAKERVEKAIDTLLFSADPGKERHKGEVEAYRRLETKD